MRGIITVLNTPFSAHNQLDTDSLRHHVRYALQARVAGFLVPAMASEVDKLTDTERHEMVATVLEEVKHCVPVIGGASASTQRERIIYAKQLIDLGCEGVLLNIPYQNDTQYTHDIQEIAALSPGFLMIQDWDFHGYGLPVSLIQSLFQQIEVFRWLKIEVVPAGTKYTGILEVTRGKLFVSGGWAVMQMIEALDRGVHAFMPTGMHEIYTAIYDLYQQGNREAAQHLFYQLLPVLAFSNQHLDISIHFFKHLLYKQGIYATPNVREPILPFDSYHQHLAGQLIDRVLALIQDVRTGRY